MKKNISIAIVGNCQARPLAQVVQSLIPRVNIAGIAIVHLLRDEQQSDYAAIFETADLIFAQRVTDNYPCSFVRNTELRKKYGDRVRIWPNLYFAGYNPELMYLRTKAGKPLSGPLLHYHIKTFFNAWRDGLSVADTVWLSYDEDYNKKAYSNIPDNSLEELRKREAETDVRIVEWIAERMWRRRLFFTFNHPVLDLIRELAIRLCMSAGLEAAGVSSELAVAREPLGQISCPVNPWVAKTYNCSFEEVPLYRGYETVIDAGDNVILGRQKAYEIKEVIEEYFKIYDACEKHMVC